MTDDNDNDIDFTPEAFDPATGTVHGTRKRNGKLERGAFSPMREGEELMPGDEIAQIVSSSEGKLRMRSLYRHKGPSRASNRAYRNGYDAVFGRKKEIN